MRTSRMIATGMMGVGWKDVIPPSSAFNWLPFTIQRKGNYFRVPSSFNLRSYANISVTKTYWVKPAAEGGNDSATGADEAHAFASINKALTKTDVDRIMVKAGLYGITTYPSSHSWNNASPARNVEIIGYGGEVISTSSVENSSLTWSAVSSHYEASYATTINRIYDASVLDTNGDHTKLTLKASSVEVDATAGSWFYDTSAKIIYVHTSDARMPDANLFCYIGAPNGSINDAVTYYIEGITFYGGTHAFLGPSAAIACNSYFKNCKFKYSTGDCVAFTGGNLVILQTCEVAECEADGIHFEVSGASSPNLVLIDVIARNNGVTGNTNSNGYSRHGPGNTIAINCRMNGNYGPNIKDINTGTYLWCLGAHNYTPVSATSRMNYGVGDTTATAKMWLDGCISDGVVDADLYVGPSATAYIHNMIPASPTVSGGGAVVAY